MDQEFDLNDFMTYAECALCGSQRCEPENETWRMGCPHWKNYLEIKSGTVLDKE